MNEYAFGAAGIGISGVKRSVELRQCRDCGYVTFTKYVTCPRCKSEKWAPRIG